MEVHWSHSKAGRTSGTRTALNWRLEGKRKRWRPKTTWRWTVEREMKEGGWGSWDEVRGVAVDRQTDMEGFGGGPMCHMARGG